MSNNQTINRISDISIRSSRRTSFPTLQGLYFSLFEGEIINKDDNDFLDQYNQLTSLHPTSFKVNLVFMCTLCISLLVCMDHGYVSGSLEWIENSFNIGYTQSSLLGSIVYLGFLLGSLISGLFIPIVKSKILLIISLVSIFLNFIYSYNIKNIIELYSSRFFCGFMQAIPIIFIPLWIEKYSPKYKVTTWLAYQQISSLIGILLGYMLSGIFTSFEYDDLISINTSGNFNNINNSQINKFKVTFLYKLFSWRGPFLINSFFIIPIIITLIFVDESTLNVLDDSIYSEDSNDFKTTGLLVKDDLVHRTTNIQSNNTQNENHKHLRRSSLLLLPIVNDNSYNKFELKELFRNPIYIFTVAAMCLIYSLSIGLLYWLNQYFIQIVGIDRFSSVVSVMTIYSIGPILGVYFGGIIGDIIIENRPSGFGLILLSCLIQSLLAFLTMIFVIRSKSYITILWGITFIIMFLTSTLPMALIVTIKCIDKKNRSSSIALTQFIFNLFGFLIIPVSIGCIMDFIGFFPFRIFSSKYNPIETAIHILLYITIPILFLYSLSLFFSCCLCLIKTNPSDRSSTIARATIITT